MSQDVKPPTYHRLLSAFKAVGPYLREDKCEKDGSYFFDCLSVCVNDSKEPEKREFWGWWMELSPSGDVFKANYQYGRFDVHGNWVEDKLNTPSAEEAERTRSVFHEKLVTMLDKDFGLRVEVDESELMSV